MLLIRSLSEPLANSNWLEHVTIFFAGSTAMGIIAHAVNTFPQPSNAYAKWLLGTIQYVVGQRMQAQRTMSEPPFENKNTAEARKLPKVD